jgi:hypothetical protein
MHEMNFRIAFRSTRGRVNVVTTEVASNVKSFLNGQVREVLVPECYDLLLGDEESEFVFASVGKLAELNAVDFRSDVRGEISDLGVLQEVGEGWIGVLAALGVLERLPRWVSAVW